MKGWECWGALTNGNKGEMMALDNPPNAEDGKRERRETLRL